jgi:periplasmic copper chaperone A
MRIQTIHLAPLARAIAFASVLLGTAAQAGTVTVSNGWIRALPANVPSGGYFDLSNASGKTVVLTGASSPACGMLMLHKTDDAGGMSAMSDVKSIPVAPGGHLRFAPGGYHLMCMDATAAIKPGNKVPVTLVFADGAKITNTFEVRNATGR